jgi:hypothetical protein
MVPQIAPDPLHGDAPDLPNTSAYVNPPDGYGVLFSASQSVGIQPTTTFAWTLTDSAGHKRPMSGENPTTSLPQGAYTVALTATGLLGSNGPQYATADVNVNDILIVAIGDSIASGEDLFENTYIGYPSRAAILSQFEANLAILPEHFAALAQAIKALDPGQVLVTGYPDITRNQNGNVAAILGPGDVTLISKKNARFASEMIIPALDATIAASVKTYGWTPVNGINTDFRTHGYPSDDSWVRTLGESFEMQGDDDGTFHPNAAGQLDFARHFLEAYMATLRKDTAKAENRGR